MKTKTFDCVQMKRRGAEQVMKRLEGKTVQEQLEYWRKGTEELITRQQSLKKNKGQPEIG
ncbi:MAG TPA: hypothetical protein PLU87_19480 [Sedimentisphaerales bacterium]|nr:hypothetical protein [Sedimentisphaerales bacterium]HRS13257.1 hypothetical protein [Sedimentisphaerales bacterium]HRV49884.1 hypothetical protein [Sedimentisphaerales bacterium]